MEQEKFWKGSSGDEYIDRNRASDLLSSYTMMWSRVLARTRGVKTVLEVGANVGINLQAIQRLIPDAQLAAVEPNEQARAKLESLGIEAHNYLAEDDWKELDLFDLVFTRGVLIHVNPANLDLVYQNLVSHSSKYIMVAEYFAPKREMINYRGKDNLLWRADYAGELMDKYGLKLIDYFFVYKRDVNAPQDNITVFLMEKTK